MSGSFTNKPAGQHPFGNKSTQQGGHAGGAEAGAARQGISIDDVDAHDADTHDASGTADAIEALYGEGGPRASAGQTGAAGSEPKNQPATRPISRPKTRATRARTVGSIPLF